MAIKRVLLIAFAACTWLGLTHSLHAQAAAEEIVITGEEVGSAYGAPKSFSRSRFSNLTNAYVLPPWTFYFGEIYEGAAPGS